MATNRPVQAGRTGVRHATRRADVWRRFTARLAMLAIAIQCLVVQTHVDFSAWARPTTAAYAIGAPIQPTAGVDTHQGDGRAPNACLICQEVALAGGAVLGAATAVTPNAGGQIEAIFVASAPVLEARRSHAWRSRAPPSRA